MARLPRIDLSGIAQHIVQRGNDRQPCFAGTCDYAGYLRELAEAAIKHGCAIHAYVLMTNHVHLLATPQTAGAVSRMMQAIGRRYVGCFNARYRRTGTLWEGRYKSALVGTSRYALTCYRYIELNPVRARMVVSPGDYRWSSHGHNALGNDEAFITTHSAYRALGENADARRESYRALFDEPLSGDDMDEIRRYTQQQRVYGSERLRRQVETLTQRTTVIRPRGRPRNDPDVEK
jgi:REP-associated tyrosine transposase